MEYVTTLIDFILHIDVHLSELIRDYGATTYAILFAIVFVETGLVVMPFLPGDSLLFAAGAFAGKGDFNLLLLGGLLTVAAIVGDSLNYSIGKYIGPRVFEIKSRFINRAHLERTHQFFEKHGGKTIVIARFMPIVRTFAPFVAGVGSMNYARFIAYNVLGAVVWVWGFLLLGYLFGNLPAVKKNFTLVIMAIVVLSVLPGVIEVVRARMAARRSGTVDAG